MANRDCGLTAYPTGKRHFTDEKKSEKEDQRKPKGQSSNQSSMYPVQCGVVQFKSTTHRTDDVPVALLWTSATQTRPRRAQWGSEERCRQGWVTQHPRIAQNPRIGSKTQAFAKKSPKNTQDYWDSIMTTYHKSAFRKILSPNNTWPRFLWSLGDRSQQKNPDMMQRK